MNQEPMTHYEYERIGIAYDDAKKATKKQHKGGNYNIAWAESRVEITRNAGDRVSAVNGLFKNKTSKVMTTVFLVRQSARGKEKVSNSPVTSD